MDEPTQNTDNDTQPSPGVQKPSSGLPPETPRMPGTRDHHIEAGSQTNPAPALPLQDDTIMPEHDVPRVIASPQPTSAPTIPTPAPTLEAEQPPVVPNTTQVPAPPPPAQPLRTSMQDVSIRGVADASAKDYGVLPTPHHLTIPPLPSTNAPQGEYHPTAQDSLYQSAAGKPLDGPVIPSTRSQSTQTRPPLATHLNPATLESAASPHEMAQDTAAAGMPPQTPAEAANELAHRSAIRTLESDVAKTVAEKKLSISGMALAQQRQTRENETGEPQEKRFSWWALSGIILAVVGVAIVTIAYISQTKTPDQPTEVTTAPDALIPGVSETVLDVTGMVRSDMLRAFSALIAQYASRDGIFLVRLTTFADDVVNGETVHVQHDVSAEQFFAQLSSRAPSRLYRALGTQSFLGVVSRDGKATPFLAFETTSYDSAFAGMLEWETYMLDDLPFITYTPPPPVSAPIVATSTASTTVDGTETTTPAPPQPAVVVVTPQTPAFLDTVVKNHDVRLAKNDDGSTRLLYAFPTPVILIISQNGDAFGALIDQLTTARFSR